MIKHFTFIFTVISVFCLKAEAAPQITATIKPVHSIVAYIADGVTTPHLLLDGSQSPHDYALKPSQMRQIKESDIIFLIGYQMESFLKKPLSSLPENVTIVQLIDADGVKLLPLRDENRESGHTHEKQANDPHIWLAPENAIAMAEKIAAVLIEKDPANKETYLKNKDSFIKYAKEQSVFIKERLLTYSDKPFIVFHDAFRYFEDFTHLNSKGAVLPSGAEAIGAKRLAEINKIVQENNTECIFTEPQYPASAVKAISQNGKIHVGLLDDLGYNVPEGKNAYFTIMNNITDNIISCLKK